MKIQVKHEIKDLIKNYFSQQVKPPFVLGKTRIPLNIPSCDWEEVCEAIESFLSTNVTMGKKVAQFESMFADYIGVKYATMVNSGSSANLIALSILTNPVLENRIQRGDEITNPPIDIYTCNKSDDDDEKLKYERLLEFQGIVEYVPHLLQSLNINGEEGEKEGEDPGGDEIENDQIVPPEKGDSLLQWKDEGKVE